MADNSETTGKAATAQPLKGGVVPYLMLDGADKAIAFYVKAFGAVPVGSPARTDDGRVMNARLDINDGSVMLMDPMPEHGYPATTHDGFNLHLHVDDADRWFSRAVGSGCTAVMPVELQFWGDRYGMVADPFGIKWGIGSTPAA